LLVGDHRSRRESGGHFDRAVRDRPPPDVRERIAVPGRHAAGAGLVLGAGRARRHDALSDLAAGGRGPPPRQGPGRVYRVPETRPASSGAVRVVVESMPTGRAPTPRTPGPPNSGCTRPGRRVALRVVQARRAGPAGELGVRPDLKAHGV